MRSCFLCLEEEESVNHISFYMVARAELYCISFFSLCAVSWVLPSLMIGLLIKSAWRFCVQ